jgi:hypothetical protein
MMNQDPNNLNNFITSYENESKGNASKIHRTMPFNAKKLSMKKSIGDYGKMQSDIMMD